LKGKEHKYKSVSDMASFNIKLGNDVSEYALAKVDICQGWHMTTWWM
jgi:hypothetical protein